MGLLVALLPFVNDPAEAQPDPDPVATRDPASFGEPESVDEIVGERTEDSKTYATDEEGVFVTEVFAEPVHVADDATGALVDIDTTLEKTGVGTVESAATPVGVEISLDGAAAELVTITLDGDHRLSFGLDGAAPVVGEVAADSVVFGDVLADTSVEFEAMAGGVKESIVLDSVEAPTTYRYPLTLDGLTAELDPVYGHVWFYDADAPAGADPVALVPQGWMVDANWENLEVRQDQAYSEGVDYALVTDRDGDVSLEVSVDAGWLAEPGRAWPVTVDPTFVQYDAGSDDTYVTPFVSTDRSTLSYFYSGSLGTFYNYPYLHLDTSAVDGKLIHSAQFKALQTSGTTCTETATSLHRVTEPWAGLNLTWANRPGIDAAPVATVSSAMGGVGCEAAQWVTWGLTDTVRNWADGTWPNYGLSMRAAAPLDPENWKRFASGNNILPPHVQILWSEPGAAGAPDPPTAVAPTGPIDTVTPTLSAGYADPDGDQGYVLFVVADDVTNEQVFSGIGTLGPSQSTSTLVVPAGVLSFETTYRLEAISIDDPSGAGDPADPTTIGSVEVVKLFTPTTSPLTPTAISPVGVTADPTATFSAVYEDRDGEDGYVRFEIFDAVSGAPVGTLDGTTVPTGGASTVEAPAGTIGFGGSYRVVATSIDASSSPSPSALTTYLNVTSPAGPVYDDDFPDPAIVTDGTSYYAYATNVPFVNLQALTSTNLVDWGQPTDAMPLANMGDWADATPNLLLTWAPAVRRFGADWVLYYSARDKASDAMCIGRAVSTSGPSGEFLDGDGQGGDPGETPMVCPFGGVIDPSFYSEAGKTYLLWKTDNVPSGQTNLVARELDNTGLGFEPGSTEIDLLSELPQTWELGGGLVEQPEMIMRGGTRYLFYAANDWASANYAVGYATCASFPAGPCDKVTTDAVGPWFANTDSVHTNRVFETDAAWGPGAASFVTDSVSGTWMAYHGWKDPAHIHYAGDPEDDRALYIDKTMFTGSAPSLSVSYPTAADALVDIDAGDALGGGNSAGRSINIKGQISGTAVTATGGTEAVWWDDDLLLQDLGPLTAEPEAFSAAINDSTALAGRASDGILANDRGLRWFPYLVWSPIGSPIDYVEALSPGGYTQVADINNNSDLVGSAVDYPTAAVPTAWPSPTGEAERLFSFGEFSGGDYGAATGVNDHGDIVGYGCPDPLCTTTTGFMRTNATTQTLDQTGFVSVTPIAVNDNDLIVGSAQTAAGATRAVAWEPGQPQVTDIGANFPGDSEALGLNNFGQVVGYWVDPAGNEQGFVWTDGTVFPIGSPGARDLGGGAARVYDINDQGLMTGTSRLANGDWHAFIAGTFDPSETYGPAGPTTVVPDGPGLSDTTDFSLSLALPPPNLAEINHCIDLDITVDTGGGAWIVVLVELSDSSGVFWTESSILTPNTPNHPLNNNPPSFNTDDRWPVSVNLTVQTGSVLSWDVLPYTC